jgi:phosphopantothenoylcysteine decarboxylase / phosphopantothenate---cysteine ligase
VSAPPASERRVAVHVSGSVAAYKACEVITALRKNGCEVRVAMTAGAPRFITSVTLQSLSGHPVLHDAWDTLGGHGMGHIELGAWAHVHVAVAASASLIARLAHGLADDAVTTALLATRAPLLIAPAMETAMWEHPATAANVEMLRSRGVRFIGPVSGRLASGADGAGRMADVAAVVEETLARLIAG